MSVATAARTPTAQDRAAATLRTAILDGELRPGQRVNQEAWAERAGVSLIPVREALRALAGEGLVTYRPRRGYAVTELDLAELEEVYRLRRLLETDALLLGVERATPADLRALEAAADDCSEAAADRRRCRPARREQALPRPAPRARPQPAGGAAARRPLGLDRGLPRALLRAAGRSSRGRQRPSCDHRRGGRRRCDAGGGAPGCAPRAGARAVAGLARRLRTEQSAPSG